MGFYKYTALALVALRAVSVFAADAVRKWQFRGLTQEANIVISAGRGGAREPPNNAQSRRFSLCVVPII